MRKKCFILKQKGFTLIELMAVMVIMGVMVSIAIKKFDILSDTASITRGSRTQYPGNPDLDRDEIIRYGLDNRP
jgi:prepilin-type N-terminal cleavage/methylation domain-containing protein